MNVTATPPRHARLYLVSWRNRRGDRRYKWFWRRHAALQFAERVESYGFDDVVVEMSSTTWREVPR